MGFSKRATKDSMCQVVLVAAADGLILLNSSALGMFMDALFWNPGRLPQDVFLLLVVLHV